MSVPYYQTEDRIPLPPTDADVLTTACDYCIVACGYKIYRWPVGTEGGPKASENALACDFPRAIMQGNWISPNMHNIVQHEGRDHHVVIVGDGDTEVVNVGGDHSIRGGTIAKKCYNPKTPTKDRLQTPLLRVNGELVPISWDQATDIFAGVSQHVIDKHGAHAWAQKRFSYQFFENTYALSKFAWVSVGTPATAEHDNPGHFSSTPGWRDIGFENFAASYEDYYLADTVVLSGADPYETKTILFNEWILKGAREKGNKLIFINPRKTTGPAFAESSGGMHLWINPGTDTLLHLGIARVVLESGWEDREWIDEFTNNKWESDSGFGQGVRNTPWQWRTTWGQFQCDGFEAYKEWVLSQKESELDYVSQMTGISVADIRKAAEMMAKPKADGSRTKTTIGIEKGTYWSNNYLNTASIGSLALLCGTGNRPGQMISRMGGHQRGGMTAGGYPRNWSPEKFAGRRRKGLDLDRWVEAGKVRFAWVVGTTWVNAMTGTTALFDKLSGQTVESEHQVRSTDVD
ncbi:MAG: arsenite oxidase large subunit, partial [Gemmatimonadaceae bacterium]|nr:arsenite oxidase large subunit [Gemmatimonadaceae bacterium]